MFSYVLDVNIWISLFDKKEYPEKLVEWIVSTGNTIYRSDVLTNEMYDVMNRLHIIARLKKPILECLEFYNDVTTWVATIPIFTYCPDPKDNYLFDLAIQSQADYLVTGDKTVLYTPIKPPTKIISFAEFREMFV